ncbi:MAG: 4Fe-4S dicluster domain-containing protein [Candidatus Methanomethylophilaceae archaeon]
MDIREDISGLMDLCIGCGICETVCPSFSKGGCDPMAVMKRMTEDADGCIGCGSCTKECPYTRPDRVMKYLNHKNKGLGITACYRETGLNMPRSPDAGMPEPHYSDDGPYLNPGCVVLSKVPYLEYAGTAALDAVGTGARRADVGCCTHPVTFMGLTDGERDSVKRDDFRSLGEGRMVTLCPGCSDEYASSGADAVHILRTLHDNIDSIRGLPGVSLKVCIQPGCGLRDMRDMFRDVAEACGATVIDAPFGCCGKAIPRISEELMADRQREMAGADAVIVGCPLCQDRYDSVRDGIPSLHISELVMMASGDRSTLPYHKIPLDK